MTILKSLSEPLLQYFKVNTRCQEKSHSRFTQLAHFFLIYTYMEQFDEFESAKKGVKKTKRLSVSIGSETFDRLKAYIDANGYDTSKLVDKILQKFLDAKK